MKKNILAIIIGTAWVSINEFLRNQLLFGSVWQEHYKSLGLEFPTKTLNGVVWGIWALIFTVMLYVLLNVYSRKRAAAIGWVMGFVLMWITIGNLLVLPGRLLFIAVPWSILETYGACWVMATAKK